jgi:hypothetical protein
MNDLLLVAVLHADRMQHLCHHPTQPRRPVPADPHLAEVLRDATRPWRPARRRATDH